MNISNKEVSEFITIARVAKTQGRRGEVACDLVTDFPERFEERKHLHALDERGRRRELELEAHWPHQQRMVLKFSGIDSITDAETLIGDEIQIPKELRAALETGAAYISDLVGCVVHNVGVAGRQPSAVQELKETEPESLDRPGGLVGVVEDVQFGAGDAPLLVVKQGRVEHLIPFAAEFIKTLDTAGKRIEMLLPEGLLEANLPGTPNPGISKLASPKTKAKAGVGGKSKEG